MDRTKLINQLEGFKQACSDIGCIDSSNKNALDLEEAYPGAEPASYIITIMVKQDWLDRERSTSPLRELIDLLYEKVDSEIRKNILTFSLQLDDKVEPLTRKAA
jgi:hypothetical protein